MGYMGLGGIAWFLPIDKKFPELGNGSVADTLGLIAGISRTRDPHLENREMWGTRSRRHSRRAFARLGQPGTAVPTRVWLILR
jgi:hypothetical protein